MGAGAAGEGWREHPAADRKLTAHISLQRKSPGSDAGAFFMHLPPLSWRPPHQRNATMSRPTMTKKSHSPQFRLFKYSVYALLTFNILLFLLHGTAHEALDSLGWVILLATFEYESTSLTRSMPRSWKSGGLFAFQCLGYGLAIYATSQYIMNHEWVDVLNAVTWLLVCAVLAYDVYVPGTMGARNGKSATASRRGFTPSWWASPCGGATRASGHGRAGGPPRHLRRRPVDRLFRGDGTHRLRLRTA